MKWQPIETAPRDGTVILILLHKDIAQKTDCQMEICRYENRPLLGETWTAQNDGFSCGLDCATHWIPLPDTPKFNDDGKAESAHNAVLCDIATITLSIQDAVRIMELMNNGSFPIDAMKDGRYVAWEDFRNDICQKIDKGEF